MASGERALIKSIKSFTASSLKRSRVGIGDDCAVLQLPLNHELLVTTDFSLEGVHFQRDWHPPEIVGHRCLARGLSDIAAMGGTPFAAFLSLAVPEGSQTWVVRFVKGLLALAKQHKIELAGGDTAQSPAGICADIIVAGNAPQGRALLRSGARPGDAIYVTGDLGGAAATLAALFRGEAAGKAYRSSANRAHFYPQPRLAVGRFLLEKRIATAAIDISDGLSTDLSHICEESLVGARIYSEAIPIARRAWKEADSLRLALHGGDDYELLFTARSHTLVPRTIAGVPVNKIGEIVSLKKLSSKKTPMLLEKNGREQALKPQGWEHFKKSRR